MTLRPSINYTSNVCFSTNHKVEAIYAVLFTSSIFLENHYILVSYYLMSKQVSCKDPGQIRRMDLCTQKVSLQVQKLSLENHCKLASRSLVLGFSNKNGVLMHWGN